MPVADKKGDGGEKVLPNGKLINDENAFYY